MSLGLATNSALGGLRATALGTRLVAENLANAETEGYGTRSLAPINHVSPGLSGGTRVSPVQRDADPTLLGALRSADGARIRMETVTQGLATLEKAFGIPGEPGAISSLVTAVESGLRQAASSPDSTAALQNVAQDAARLVTKFNTLETGIQTLRQQADETIGTDVDTLNTALGRVVALNKDIQRQTLLGGDPYPLMDERQRVVSQIAQIIPITEIARDDNRIMLLSARGETLADMDQARFSFTPATTVTAADTLGTGALSGVTLNGRVLAANDATLGQGRLGANLHLRDTVAPGAQANLDLLANDLLNRFAGPGADQTLAVGELGLFTLSDATSLPADRTGLAGKMRLSSVIDPTSAETAWRLRSGLNATLPGPSAETATLTAMIDAMTAPTSLATGMPARDVSGHAASLAGTLATARLGAEENLAYAETKHAAFQSELAGRGVDTDAQMQNLLALERAYAANARVLAAVDEMMRNLLEI